MQSIRDALDTYAEQMKIDLKDNPFAEQVKGCDSPEAILKLLEKNRDEFKEYRDKNRKFIDCLNPVVKFVHAFSNVLGEATSFIPFQPAKLIFVGIDTLFTAAEGVSASYDALLELFESIGSFLKRLEIYTKISLSSLMTEIIAKIMVELLSILAQAKKQIKNGRLKQFAKKLLGDSEIENILRRLDRLTQEEARMMEAHILELVHGLMNNMKVVMDGGETTIIAVRETLATMMNQLNRNRFHENSRSWLSPPNPSENQVNSRRGIRDGSAMWFTLGGTFEDWNAKGYLLWIHGKPGSGKSILCSAIIKKVMALDEAGFLAGLTAYYYFDFRSKAKQDLRGLLSSLVVQFCAKSDPCYQILLRLYSTHYNGSQLPDDDALVQCLKEMLAALLEQPRIYLIVDALDECPCTSGVVSPRDSVLELIEDLVESRLPNLRICVTSRPEADILESLGPLATHTVSLHDEDGQKQDIVDHVTFVVHSDRRMRKWRVEDKKLVIDTLSEKADGMFRWVFCQLEALRHRIPGMIARALKELPQTLDETYGRILSGIDKDIQEYAHRLFQCLCVSIRPLRLAELAEALSIIFVTKPESEDYIDWRSEESQQALLSSCSSIVTVVNTDGSPVVQFAHFSVREYLMSDRLAMPGERYTRYHVRPHSSHVTLARASLGALLSLGDQVDERAVEEYHPLAIYGAHHWVDHVKFGTVSLGIQDLMERLFDRNSPYFATWVWIYDFDHPFRGQMTTTHPEEPEASPLYYAALCSLPNIIENLAMTHPGDVNGIGGRYATPLNAALAKGDLNVAQVLLECGVDVNSQGDKGRSPLHLASLSGNCDTVQWLLAHQADINIAPTDEMHVTPLLLAAFYGRLEVCLLLVGHGAHIDAPGEASGSPLQAASICGHLDIVLFLLNCGASLDYRNYEGQTTLAMASRFGCTEVVRLLIKRGADVASRDDNRLTPLHHASKQGHANIVQDLLDNRGDPNAQDQDLQTPLHLASDAGYLGIVQLLIQHGSVLDTTDRHQDTPLHLALRNGNPEIARTLIKNGANTISEDRDGHTPLHHASQHELLDLMGILLQGGVDVNIRNSFKKTPLHLASGGGEVDLVGFLIERGADVNVEDVALSSPLHYASANGHLDVAELLIERGADIHKQTSLQEIPLHLSSDNGRLEVVRFLVRCGSHVGSRNFEGQSSLHVAAREGHQDIVELLLESGADINVRDINYELPLDVASRNGKVKVARFLAEQMGLAPPDVVSQDGESVSRPLLKGENGGSDQETLNDKDNMTMQEASRRGLFTVVQFLLDRGIDVNSRNKCRETSLHAASENGILEVAQLLIDRGADVDCRNNNGEAPLHLSSTSGNVDIVRLLLDRGAHVDTICQDRLTPLHRASEKDHFEVAQLLIERGADVNAVGDYGVTPLRMALFVDSEDCRIIQLLMDHGAT